MEKEKTNLPTINVPLDTSILIIEDSGIQAKVFIGLLKELGFENVGFCANSEHAFEKIHARKPKIIFCDWEMPKVSGIEVLKQVRQNDEYSSIPFIFLTANSGKEHVIKAISSGASDYIVKPASIPIIAEKLSKISL